MWQNAELGMGNSFDKINKRHILNFTSAPIFSARQQNSAYQNDGRESPRKEPMFAAAISHGST
jgi:hypothetical protein